MSIGTEDTMARIPHHLTLSSILAATAALFSACDGANPDVNGEALVLPGEAFHPEGLAFDAAGNLYIGSVGTGEVVRLRPEADEVEAFVPAGSGDMSSVVGLVVDEEAELLWACSADPHFEKVNALKSFDLATGEALDSFELPGAKGICNDLVQDPDGNLYVTDSMTGRILRLPVGGTALEVWSEDPVFADKLLPFMFSANGADYHAPTHSLYVVSTYDGALYRVALRPDGGAEQPIRVALDRKLVSPDGLRVYDDDTLLVVEGTGLTRVRLDGDAGAVEVITEGMEDPSGLIVDGVHAWVAEGQVGRLVGYDWSAKVLPFRLWRVAVEDEGA
ncbi:MAG: hypothetical protein IT383_07360 [Deltaproteobacteria bacterium]|nr:hypothetical protein [Deltaproteobacteria bacterium]